MKRLTWIFVLFFAFTGLGTLAASAQQGYGYRSAPRYYAGFYAVGPMPRYYYSGYAYRPGYYGPGYYRHERMERRRFIMHQRRERQRFYRHERRERFERRHGRW